MTTSEPAGGGRSRAWARALRRRHARSEARPRAAGMTLHRAPRPLFVGGPRIRWHVQPHFAWTIAGRTTRITTTRAAQAAPAAVPVVAPSLRRRARSVPAQSRASRPAAWSAPSPRFVHASRPWTTAARSLPAAVPTITPTPARPLPRVDRSPLLRRRLPVAEPVEAARAFSLAGRRAAEPAVRRRQQSARVERRLAEEPLLVARRTPGEAGHGWTASPATPFAAAFPPATSARAPEGRVDVDALTEQVVERIDRRLIAYRERMGTV
jgi:hypothetical protein